MNIAATVGRILAHHVKWGVFDPVATIRKAAKTNPWAVKRRVPERLPKPLRVGAPDPIVELNTVCLTLAPGKDAQPFAGSSLVDLVGHAQICPQRLPLRPNHHAMGRGAVRPPSERAEISR